jgi:hypothetical protein
MIKRTSRYYNGPIAQLPDKSSDLYVLSVYRDFPTNVNVNYINYIWKDRDEVAIVAATYKLPPRLWWQIGDLNPEISDMFNIQPGTVVRIPYAN